MGKLINIDNGGTLTDICVSDGDAVYRTKTLTTPFDLSKCFFDGLVKVSKQIYGQADIVSLLASTDHIRYSTTQGTNALVERKGPRLGLLLSGSLSPDDLTADDAKSGLFASLVGDRVASVDLSVDDESLEVQATRAINALTSRGANRIVVADTSSSSGTAEVRLKAIFLRKFPQHLLGAVPILYSHEVVADQDDVRRIWTALFNAFLHPAMERFLYNAEHKLRINKANNPLLIFRNDGHSARVAKTIAAKTYSSGPRGGMEGARAMVRQHGIKHLVSIDIGGTTTDIGEVRDGRVREELRGVIEGVEVSFPLCDLVSSGVGGSSIIKAEAGKILVGPHSVGSAPGPACFGLGGTEATITDAFLLGGLLDPESYFGGELRIDIERARAAIRTKVAEPLGLDESDAVQRMEQAWVDKIAKAILAFTDIDDDTVLAAFGGAGPMVVCSIAEAAGVRKVLIPGLAAVFSAFGLGFSDIAHEYDAPIADASQLQGLLDKLMHRARRGMQAEGFALADCNVETWLQVSGGEADRVIPLEDSLPSRADGESHSVLLRVRKSISQPKLKGRFGEASRPAVSSATRAILHQGQRADWPLYRAEEQPAGARDDGPAVIEESFFTSRINAGWSFEFNESGDVLLSRN